MKRSRVAAIAVLLCARGAWAQSNAGALTFAEYTHRLDEIASQVDAQSTAGRTKETSATYPLEWIVGANGQRFTVDARQIDADLDAWTEHADAGARARLAERLRELRKDAADFDRAPADPSLARSQLAGILATNEFGEPDTQWQERIRAAVIRALEAILRPIFGSALVQIVSRGLVYVLIVAALGILVFGGYRVWPRASSTVKPAPPEPVVPQRTWQEWRAAADIAAAEGRWRDAVRGVYWCAVLALEAQGAWRPDRARTPREYLRAMAEDDRHRAAFTRLTDSFERVWYAGRDANHMTFTDMVARVNELEC